jgi:hypothetical protein
MGHFVGPVITGLILARLGLPALVILPIVSIPIGFALAYQLRANHPHPRPAQGDDKIRLQASLGFILLLAIVATLQSWSQANMINFVPKYIKDLGLSAATYGNIAGLFMGGSALGNVIGGISEIAIQSKVSGSIVCSAANHYESNRMVALAICLIPLAGACTGSVQHHGCPCTADDFRGMVGLRFDPWFYLLGRRGMLLTGPLAENYGFPTVLVMTTGLVLLASPLALMLRENTASWKGQLDNT